VIRDGPRERGRYAADILQLQRQKKNNSQVYNLVIHQWVCICTKKLYFYERLPIFAKILASFFFWNGRTTMPDMVSWYLFLITRPKIIRIVKR
jgi:hypothetical protein